MGRLAAFGTGLASLGLTAALLPGAALDGRATRDRPPPGYTGGFAEPSCTQCHIDADANTGRGSLAIHGLPERYDAGATYVITITLAHGGLRAAGFQLSARFADGTGAGTLRVPAGDSLRVDVTALNGVQYSHHLYEGTEPAAPDTACWRIEWTAPDSGAVVLHAAANAADGDSSPLGDFIYLTSAASAGVR